MSTISEKRRKSREQAFILLFEKSFNEDMSFDEIIQIAVESEVIEKDAFMVKLLNAADDGIAEIDAEIEKNLKGWSKSRISKVSLALLRMAIAEMMFMDDIPVGVSINEAVEICKIYGSDEDKSFVNGVLGSVARSLEA
ncbi:MAG: transcription antitermination factor NusB [Clostridia bacterium]|nr:transcription antitermination factor NusB [Clostridia bacterium]